MRKFLTFICIIAAVIFFIPLILSQPLAISLINENMPDGVHVKKVKLSWNGTQRFYGITSQYKNLQLNIEEASITQSLYTLVTDKNPVDLILNKATFINPTLYNQNQLIADKIKLTPYASGYLIKARSLDKDFSVNIDLIKNTFIFSSAPSILLASLTPNFPTDLVLGEYFDLILTHKPNTKIFHILLKSNFISLVTEISISNHSVSLTKDLLTTFSLTTKLSNHLFNKYKIRPISLTPIEMSIPHQGVNLPLDINNLKQATIPKLYLSLGKVQLKNAKILSDLLSVLKFEPRFHKNVDVWFQNTTLSISNGTIQIPRTECLVDHQIEVALIGSITPPDLDMNLIIPGSTLTSLFQIKKTLPEDFGIIFPINGPMENMKFHKSSGLREIALLRFLPDLPTMYKPIPPKTGPTPWDISG